LIKWSGREVTTYNSYAECAIWHWDQGRIRMKIGLLDVRILSQGIRNGGRIDEHVLEGSELAKAGTGRVLDCLASLAERGLIRLNDDKSFQVTESARRDLWDQAVPPWVRILRMLDIGAQDPGRLAAHLNEGRERIDSELEGLRRSRLVMMSALRSERGLEQVFEILPEGQKRLEEIRMQAHPGPPPEAGADSEILDLLTEIVKNLRESDLDEASRERIISKVSKVRSKLDA